MPWTLQNYIDRVRQKIDDTAISNRLEEDLTDQVIGGNGSRVAFPLSHRLVVTGSGFASINQAAYSQSGFTVNTTSGVVTFGSAPPLSTTVPTNLKFLYTWQQFTDSVYWPAEPNFDIDNFINEGLQRIGVDAITTDTQYTLVNQTNFDVVCLYAAAFGCYELSNRYSRFVNTSAGGTSSGKDVIAKNYQMTGDKYFKQAEDERLAAQGFRQARSTVAALTIKNTLPASAFYTPPR